MIETYDHTKSSDVHNQVYGLVGLISPTANPIPYVVDYRRSVEQVYYYTMGHLYEKWARDPGGRLWPEGGGDIWLRTRRERLQKMLGLDEITMVDEVEIVEFFAKSDLMMPPRQALDIIRFGETPPRRRKTGRRWLCFGCG